MFMNTRANERVINASSILVTNETCIIMVYEEDFQGDQILIDTVCVPSYFSTRQILLQNIAWKLRFPKLNFDAGKWRYTMDGYV